MKTKILLLFTSLLFISNILLSQHWEGIGISSSNSDYNCLYTDTINNLLYIGGSKVSANGVNYKGIVS